MLRLGSQNGCARLLCVHGGAGQQGFSQRRLTLLVSLRVARQFLEVRKQTHLWWRNRSKQLEHLRNAGVGVFVELGDRCPFTSSLGQQLGSYKRSVRDRVDAKVRLPSL